MISTNERIEIFNEVLAKLAPELRARRTPNLADPTLASGITLSGLLERVGPLPPYSALLGVCEDGLPLLLDLTDPSPGSFLIVGDERSGKAHLLQAILASACYLNPPERVAVSVITPHPGLFEGLESIQNCRAVLSAYDRNASEYVIELSALAEQRRYGRHQGQVEILALHDMPEFVQYNDYEVNSYLKWLVEHGPSSSIWTIASIKASQLWRIRDGFYEAFGSQLTGRSSSTQITSGQDTAYDRPQSPGVFSTQVGDEWIRFWVPQDG